ncbi:hypothetical protein OOJ91_10405 [Micromonospora lupini]|uniref:hypothetical protein n=1 Tax=Micromonospora lupini TaxID=285679 RepID=UPI002251CB9B|nr:hypothetical protein [Micromonospora lupini]MCX5066287.1 hypothetical protein [Micromonospora lupini]
MRDDEPGSSPLPYAEVTDEAYATQAAAGFQPQEFEFAVVLSGRCPRCDHPSTTTLVDEVYRKDAATPDTGYRTLLCECDAEHPGRPAGLRGCGAYWTLWLEVEA